MGSHSIPRGDQPFFHFAKNFVQLVSSDPEIYDLSEDRVADLMPLFDSFKSALLKVQDPSTRTQPTIEGKNAARSQLENFIRPLIATIRAVPTVTTEMRIELQISVRDGGGRNPRINPPTDAPCMIITDIRERSATIKLRTMDSIRRGKPAGVHAGVVYSFVSDRDDVTPPADLNAWNVEATSSRAMFTMTINNPAFSPRKNTWLCARWMNAKGEYGPASRATITELQSTMIVPAMMQSHAA